MKTNHNQNFLSVVIDKFTKEELLAFLLDPTAGSASQAVSDNLSAKANEILQNIQVAAQMSPTPEANFKPPFEHLNAEEEPKQKGKAKAVLTKDEKIMQQIQKQIAKLDDEELAITPEQISAAATAIIAGGYVVSPVLKHGVIFAGTRLPAKRLYRLVFELAGHTPAEIASWPSSDNTHRTVAFFMHHGFQIG